MARWPECARLPIRRTGVGGASASGAISSPAVSGPSRPASSGRVTRRIRRLVVAGASGPLTQLTVGLGYIPSVQFAQFYYAQQQGYYRDAGLDVTFQNKIDPDLVDARRPGRDRRRDRRWHERHPRRQPGHPDPVRGDDLRQFPNIVFAKASSGITTAAGLKGKKDRHARASTAARWIMLQALLRRPS